MQVVILMLLLVSVLAKQVLDAKKSNELQQLFSIPRVGGARFHPTKNEIMYVSDTSGVLQIYSVNVDMMSKNISTPRRLIQTNNRCTSPRYLSDGSILFLHDMKGDENFQIGIINPKDNEYHWLTKDKEAKNTVTKVTKNYLYYKSNTRDKSRFDVYRRKLPLEKDSIPELLYSPSSGHSSAVLTDRNEKRIILKHHHSNVHGEILLLDKDGTVRSLTKPISGAEEVRWTPLRFLNKRRTILLVKTDFESDFLRLGILKFKTWNSVPKFIPIRELGQFPYDVLSVMTNHKTKASYIELNKDGYSELLRVRIGFKGFIGKIKKVILPLKRGVISRGDIRSFGRGMSLSKDGKTMAISMSNSATPVDIYILELNHPHSFVNVDDDYFNPHYWGLSLVPKPLLQMKFASESLQKFKSFDGTEIQYYLLLPFGVPPKDGFPTVVRLHGGPEAQSRPSFNAIHQYLVKNGFAVVLPNVRGSRGYGRDFMDKDNQEKRLDAIRDVKGVVEDLTLEPKVDTTRLFIMGGSYGGYATLLSLITFPKLWKGGVSTVGMSSLAKWRRKLRYKEYGNYETQRALLKKISPINHVSRVVVPVFFIHGENDERVPVSESINMYNGIQVISKERKDSIGERSVLLTFKDEGHGITKRANRVRTYTNLVAWLKQNS